MMAKTSIYKSVLDCKTNQLLIFLKKFRLKHLENNKQHCIVRKRQTFARACESLFRTESKLCEVLELL